MVDGRSAVTHRNDAPFQHLYTSHTSFSDWQISGDCKLWYYSDEHCLEQDILYASFLNLKPTIRVSWNLRLSVCQQSRLDVLLHHASTMSDFNCISDLAAKEDKKQSHQVALEKDWTSSFLEFSCLNVHGDIHDDRFMLDANDQVP